MNGRWLMAGILLLVLTIAAGSAQAATIIVDDDWAGADYSNIQDAVDNAMDGDRIHVNAGTYYENVDVTVEITINGNGTGPSGTMIDVSSSNAINVSANNVSLRKLHLDGVGSTGSGVYMHISNNLSFEDGLSNGFENSIWAYSCRWVRVQRSEFWNATELGVGFGDCYSVLVQACLINGTGGPGISVASTAWFSVVGSGIRSNWGTGVNLVNSNNGTIEDCNISWNNEGEGWDDAGIYSVDTDNLTVERCEV
ncbi:MAG: right-handed parallel beta-helix repeat-containing protein, partial [Thermoplasmata archaeon]|nr:right-handed parallel beta-helix repeat-containing protein [Thermoplasmata archaeon]